MSVVVLERHHGATGDRFGRPAARVPAAARDVRVAPAEAAGGRIDGGGLLTVVKLVNFFRFVFQFFKPIKLPICLFYLFGIGTCQPNNFRVENLTCQRVFDRICQLVYDKIKGQHFARFST